MEARNLREELGNDIGKPVDVGRIGHETDKNGAKMFCMSYEEWKAYIYQGRARHCDEDLHAVVNAVPQYMSVSPALLLYIS